MSAAATFGPPFHLADLPGPLWRDDARCEAAAEAFDLCLTVMQGTVSRPSPDPSLDGTCDIWTGPTDRHGYGLLGHRRRRLLTHRITVACFVATWPLPPAIDVHHECNTPACCNPRHMTLIERGDHSRLHAAHRRAKRESDRT